MKMFRPSLQPIGTLLSENVNDSLALKTAYIGISMGSDVGKEADNFFCSIFWQCSYRRHPAPIILLKNDFASILVAIEMGCLVFNNLKRVTLYLMHVSHIYGRIIHFSV